MRGLAQYAMEGRRQAIVTAFLCGLIPIVNLLAPAIIGLVCLRHGLREAVTVLAWAILPLVGWAMMGDLTPLILAFGVLLMAAVLGNTHSWEKTLVAAIVVGIAAELVLRLRPEFMAQLTTQLNGVFTGEAGQGTELAEDELRLLLFSLFGVMHMFAAVCLTMLARWWQALLYNPGGFRQEFHALRLSPPLAMVLALLFLGASFGVPVLAGWILYFIMPLFFAGLALVHGLIGLKQMSAIWLVAFYLLLLTPLVAQLLTVTALIDSWYNFRSRIAAADTGDEDKDQ